jgi:hypothetical protein
MVGFDDVTGWTPFESVQHLGDPMEEVRVPGGRGTHPALKLAA